MLSQIFEKKKVGNFPPLDHPPGGNPALFSGIRRDGSLGARDLPKIVFLEGGSPITPCSNKGNAFEPNLLKTIVAT